jgi:hypothetical protein
LPEGDILCGDAGAYLAAGECVDHHLGAEGRDGEEEEERDADNGF